MAEEGGVPTGAPGVKAADVEAEKLRLENMLRDGVSPRLPQVEVGTVPLGGDRHAFVLRLGRSALRPHIVAFRGGSQFWARNSAGKYQLDVDQIRGAMFSGPRAAERVRDFRRERLDHLLRPRDIAGSRSHEPTIILHLVPLEAFDESRPPLDLSVVRNDDRLRPLYSDHPEPIRWNLDGLYAANPVGSASVQLFRNGVVEAVESWMLKLAAPYAGTDDDVIQGYPFESTIIKGVTRYLSILETVEAGLPVVVFVALARVQRYRIQGPDPLDDYRARQEPDRGRLDRDRLQLPEAVIENWGADIPSVLRPSFDVFWQAGGFEGSPNYDGNGNWQRPD